MEQLLFNIKNDWQKSQAISILNTFLEREEKEIGYSFNAKKLSRKLVEDTWKRNPLMFNGKSVSQTGAFSGIKQKRPRPILLAACSLSECAIALSDSEEQTPLLPYLLYALKGLVFRAYKEIGDDLHPESIENELLEYSGETMVKSIDLCREKYFTDHPDLFMPGPGRSWPWTS